MNFIINKTISRFANSYRIQNISKLSSFSIIKKRNLFIEKQNRLDSNLIDKKYKHHNLLTIPSTFNSSIHTMNKVSNKRILSFYIFDRLIIMYNSLKFRK